MVNSKCVKMFLIKLIFLIGLSCKVHSASLNSDDKNVNKRETGVYIPDWAPFKTKNSEELSEFSQVPKAKPKKRLAPPMNFQLKAVAEPSDYFEEAQGESGGDDYYEKKDWSDVNRPGDKVSKNVNYTELSEIDGIVNSIIRHNYSTPVKPRKPRVLTDDTISQESLEVYDDNISKKDRLKEDSGIEEREAKSSTPPADDEYDEEAKTNLTETEKAENEAKKAKILESVDELKYRHQVEQQVISEKAKEEAFEREALSSDEFVDKYHPSRTKSNAKFENDDYEEEEFPVANKYQILPKKSKTTAEPKEKPSKALKDKYRDNDIVFTDPKPYNTYQESDELGEIVKETTQAPTPKKRKRIYRKKQDSPIRISSKYVEVPFEQKNHERISLVPELDKDDSGEPTLFFPRKRTTQARTASTTTRTRPTTTGRRKIKKAEPVSSEENTSTKDTESSPSMTAPSSTTAIGSDTTASGSSSAEDLTSPSAPSVPSSNSEVSAPSAEESGPSGQESLSSNVNLVKDAAPASSDHKKEEKKPENYHNEKGGGSEHHSEYEEETEEHGKKAYEGLHKDSKSSKGHHDKEKHHGKYDDKGGHDKHHHEESGHYGDHHHEEHGKKHAKYEESGKHSKGHSTKGSHDIHKKDEYEKNVEFFEEEGDSAEEEKHGGFKEEKGHSKGGHFKKGAYKNGHHHQANGEKGHFAKGGFGKSQKGHQASGGHDQHQKGSHTGGQKSSKGMGKQWIYHQGSPAKTANLVVIDRRYDTPYHQPAYFG